MQDGQRIVFVASGLASDAERRTETEALVKWAFGAFDKVKFFDKDAVVADADVWLGDQPTVPLVAPQLLQMLVPREFRDAVTASIVYQGPVEAPIVAGQVLGALVVEVPDQDEARFDLVAGRDVARGGLVTRLGAATRVARDRAVQLLPGRD